MILLTGGLGTIGRPLAVALRASGHTVIVCGLEHSAQPDYERCDIGDFRQLQHMTEYLHEGDTVYHLAAEFGRKNGEDFYEQCWRTNVIGTKHLIRLQERQWFRVIFASSSEVYGDLGFRKMVAHKDVSEPELHEWMTDEVPSKLLNDYAISKWVNEQQFRNSMTREGTQTMILRFFNAYGPGEVPHPYRSVVALFVHAALTGHRFDVYKDYHRAFMYIDDFIPTLARAVDQFCPGETINIGGREYTSVEELARKVIFNTGASPVLVNLIEQREHNVVSKRPVIEKAERLLGHDPQCGLDDGLPPTIAWIREYLRQQETPR